MEYKCPICGWPIESDPKKEELYRSFIICDCCGSEFGYHVMKPKDYERFKEVRQKWLDKGAPFFWEKSKPKNWSVEMAKKQIKKNLKH
jgi:hypothetical protein